MATNSIKAWALLSLFSLSAYCTAQTLSKMENVINTQKMESKILIGEVFIPKNSINEFYKQNVTTAFLKKQTGFVEGKIYERIDVSGNLHWLTVTTWQSQQAYENAQKALKEYYKNIHFNPMAFREKLGITAEHELYTLSEF